MTTPGAATPVALAEDVRALLRAGLPIQTDRCGPGLLALRGVRARALDPDEPASRARALDGLLREQLDRLENAELAKPAQLLFGAEPSTSGTTLTLRRTAAAQAAGYEVHHFRKRIEPKLLDLVAWQLQRDSEEFSTRHAEPPELHRASRPLVLPADVFAWEAAEHQHAIARLWGAVYLLRAELLTVARLMSMNAAADELAASVNLALWRHALVLAASERYRAAYGAVLLHAATTLGPQEIASSAGWTPEHTPDQHRILIECADPEQGLADFFAALAEAKGGAEVAETWRRAFTGHNAGPTEKDSTHES